MWNIMMMLCLGWKCLKKFCSISSSFLQKITFQNFKFDLMIKASFNRMYQLRHESVLETRIFLSSWPWVCWRCSYRRCFLQQMCNLEFWPPGCGSVPANFLFFQLVEVMVNLIGCKLVSLLASFLVSHLYFCVQASSPNESFSYYWNLRRSGHLSQSAWAAAFVPRTFKKNVFISFPSFCLGLWVIKCRPDTFQSVLIYVYDNIIIVLKMKTLRILKLTFIFWGM